MMMMKKKTRGFRDERAYADARRVASNVCPSKKPYINQAIRRVGVADDDSETERLQCTVRAKEKQTLISLRVDELATNRYR
jgi:hypothetical protein